MKLIYPEKTGALCAKMGRGLSGQDAVNGMVCVFKTTLRGGISATLDASYYKGPGARNGKEREFLAMENADINKQSRKYIVRRLTPTECAALQGMPRDWCEGLGGSDSAKYKAYGNGLALPCAYDVMNRIARFVEWEKTNEPDIP